MRRVDGLEGMSGGLTLVQALTAALDAKSSYTRGHSDRVAELSWAIAREAGLDENEAQFSRLAGQLHDIGKIGINDAIIGKPGPLNMDEFAIMRRHPILGASIIDQVEPLRVFSEAVRSHHERWDGSGYPDGLKGEKIPLQARIICIADSFDAMTSSRSYRPLFSFKAALEEIENCAASQFDPDLVEAFVRLFSSGESLLGRKLRELGASESALRLSTEAAL